MTYFTIYKVENLLNGHFYVGKHKTNDLNDGYMGSGKLINDAIRKHGIENFKKIIIAVLPSEEEMNRMEAEIVNEELVGNPSCYNMRVGGEGGWTHVNADPETYVKKSMATVARWSPEFREQVNAKKRRVGKNNGMYGRDRSGPNNPRFGAVVSEETRRKISEANRGKKGHSRKWTPEQRERMRISKLGMIQSDDTKKKISIAISATKWWNDGSNQVRTAVCPAGYRAGRLSFRRAK